MNNIFQIISSSFLFFFLSHFNAITQNIQIEGKISETDIHEIQFYTVNDKITNTQKPVEKVGIDSSKTFFLNFDFENTTQVFANLGKTHMVFFVEPNSMYSIDIPPSEKLTTANILNPYFEAELIIPNIQCLNRNNINDKIQQIDKNYLQIQKEISKHGYFFTPKRIRDSLIENLLGEVFHENIFLEIYQNSRICNIEIFTNPNHSKKILKSFFKENHVYLNNPAYVELFNQAFTDAFSDSKNKDDPTSFNYAINYKQSLLYTRRLLQEKFDFNNDSLIDLILLKNIFEEYFDTKYSQESVVRLLDSLEFTNTNNQTLEICKNIRQKFDKLKPGTEAPYFVLPDRDNEYISPYYFKGRYLYLNFCHLGSYTCQTNFELLQKMQTKYSEHLDILTILIDCSQSKMINFLEKNDYNWNFAILGENFELLNTYDIRTFPTYFLIDPYGKLILSPSPAPNEEFGYHFFQILKSRE